MRDAAVAIEALQADVDKANKSADAYRAMYFAKRGDITIEKVKELDEIDFHFHSALIRLMYKRIEELEAKSPKRGKWIHGKELSREYVGNCCVGLVYEDFRCSACGVTIKEREKPKWKYCPNCGAKMGVQE